MKLADLRLVALVARYAVLRSEDGDRDVSDDAENAMNDTEELLELLTKRNFIGASDRGAEPLFAGGGTVSPPKDLAGATEQGAYELGKRDGIEAARRAVRDERDASAKVVAEVGDNWLHHQERRGTLSEVLALIGGLS